jgi:hypothetical protein
LRFNSFKIYLGYAEKCRRVWKEANQGRGSNNLDNFYQNISAEKSHSSQMVMSDGEVRWGKLEKITFTLIEGISNGLFSL